MRPGPAGQGQAPLLPSPAQPSAASPHPGVRRGFVVCQRTGRSESGTVKGQLVLCLSGRAGGKEGGAAGKGSPVGAWGRQISAVLGVFPKNTEVKLSVIK